MMMKTIFPVAAVPVWGSGVAVVVVLEVVEVVVVEVVEVSWDSVVQVVADFVLMMESMLIDCLLPLLLYHPVTTHPRDVSNECGTPLQVNFLAGHLGTTFETSLQSPLKVTSMVHRW